MTPKLKAVTWALIIILSLVNAQDEGSGSGDAAAVAEGSADAGSGLSFEKISIAKIRPF